MLAAATLAIYAQACTFPFVNWDDPFYVTKNAAVRAGLTGESLAWALTGTGGVSWHPLTWLSHMLDSQLYGLDPRGHHATSVLLHLANSLLVHALFMSLTGAFWRSAAVALLFAIHPLHVEPVAWVSGRKDLLCTFFVLLATAAYAAYARCGGVWRHALVLVLAACALLAKSMAVTLPFLFLLLDWWPLRRAATRQMLVEKLPLLFLCAAAGAVTLATQQSLGAMLREAPLPLSARLANALVSTARYLRQTFWPSDLAYFYPHPYIPESGGLPLGAVEIAAAAAVLAALTLWALWASLARGRRWALVGWCWFLVALLPVSGLVQVGHQGMSDRYMYLPSLGLFVIAAWGGGEILARLWLRARPAAAGLAAAMAGGVIALGAAAWLQTSHWSSSKALFEHAVLAVPRNPTVRFNLANAQRDEGDVELAIQSYRRVLEETPNAVKPSLNLANLLRNRGKLDAAIRLYEHVLALEPDDVQAHTNLGATYRLRGDAAQARLHYERALANGPDATALFNLANLLAAEGRRGEAIRAIARRSRSSPTTRASTTTSATRCSTTGSRTPPRCISSRRFGASRATTVPRTTSARRCARRAGSTRRSPCISARSTSSPATARRTAIWPRR